MANTLLTPTMVTRKALAVLHQKLRFVGSINRQYDDSFAKDGAKIGDTLKIRLPKGEDVELARGERLILRSPDGARWAVSVDNAGAIGTTAL